MAMDAVATKDRSRIVFFIDEQLPRTREAFKEYFEKLRTEV